MIHEKYQHLLTDNEGIREVAKEILDHGFIALDNFLDEESSRKFHEVASDRSNGWKKGEELKGTAIYDFGFSDELLLFSQRLHDARSEITGEPNATLLKEKQVVGLPYKNAADENNNNETSYHFDGAYVNYLLPLVLPEDQSDGSGNLVVFPNLRLKHSPLVSKIIS